MNTITVNTASQTYPIYIGAGLLSQADLLLPHIHGQQVFIVSNETVAPLYLASLQQQLTNYQCDVAILPDGEVYKDTATWITIFDGLLHAQHHRSTTIIALGGGVIGDMAGFAAACYQRGVNFIQVPTTLLAQVDSSVGGKTAVNHPLGKNMIGAFHQPVAVVSDTNTLTSLPERELRAGLAEVIKHGLIADFDFFVWLENNIQLLLELQPEALQQAISRCCAIKAAIVSADETETGIRAILNFGHTFGHAIEKVLGFGEWLHGEAVAVGMVLAAQQSVISCGLDEAVPGRIIHLLEAAGLPTELPPNIDTEALKAAMKLDKKADDQGIKLILLPHIGKADIVTGVAPSVLEK
ncbi:MAG: 3-dehydroquinate synthase [Legionellales bacterium]|nr:3-dehydroquinate synthase [Legionellales bacterium]|tara:strand:+ start:20701 stop:21759 length:1059 start_codon:yes stop_codon:yes gene_type:complete